MQGGRGRGREQFQGIIFTVLEWEWRQDYYGNSFRSILVNGITGTFRVQESWLESVETYKGKK
jgi:hypothetical protein